MLRNSQLKTPKIALKNEPAPKRHRTDRHESTYEEVIKVSIARIWRG